jgi:hypothetical protein
MNQRTSVDSSDIFQPDEPMDQFNLDHLAALDSHLHSVQREPYVAKVSCDCIVRRIVRIVIRVCWLGVNR